MSRTWRQRDTIAPSLFPFLAVLLCTMGALVLLLMLIVAGAQSTARELADEKLQQVEEVDSQLRLAKFAMHDQLDEGRIALEKQRLALQHLENHIQEILDELAELQRTAELAEQNATTSEDERAETEQAISELEKQLLESQEKLARKLDKPDGDKPIFAIIPYAGPNGTHRRPIYLECTAEGVTIQPEGILIAGDDLQPPYGPGNPLDAALRTIRSQFAPANGAVTSTAYPLLIVRPDGIRTYAEARAAMSGWDDQFGYELVGQDLELTYPETEPGLKDKVMRALALARDRQAALVVAMPQKYRLFADREPLTGGAPHEGQGGGGGGSYGSLPRRGDMSGQGSSSSAAALANAGQRGGFALDGALDGHAQNASDAAAGLGGDASLRGFGDGSSRRASSSTTLGGQPTAGESYFGANRPANTGDGFGDEFPSNPDASGSSPGDVDATQLAQANGATNGNAAQAGGAGGQPMQMSGSQIAMPFSTPGSPAGSAGAQTANSAAAAAQSGSAAGATDNADAQSNPQLSLNQTFSNLPESSPPVAKRLGRNWAWSQGPPTQTPVARSIRMQCMHDRWVVLPDSAGAASGSVEIRFDQSPQARAEQLAEVIADRVQGWGLALTGGYWKPILEVEVADNAAWRFAQLTQLLDGSGLDVQRHATHKP